MQNDLGCDISGNDWVGQDAAELLGDAQRIHHRHLQYTQGTVHMYMYMCVLHSLQHVYTVLVNVNVHVFK